MHRHRLAALTALAATGLLLTGCGQPGLPVVAEGDASLANAVLAIRLSPQLAGINAGATDGYVLLVDEEGTARSLEAGAMDTGQLAWSDAGLFFSGPTEEYLLTHDGMVSRPRGSEEAYETSRFLTPDGEGFIAVYNVGFGDDVYLGRVTTGDAASLSSWGVTGMFESVSRCDGLVVGITDIAETNARPETSAPRTDALVQLYPEPPSEREAILATLPLPRGSLVSSTTDAPCADGTSYTLAFEYEGPEGSGAGRPVLRAWSIESGEHSVRELLAADGSPLDVEVDDVLARPGTIVDGHYLWITRSGRVFDTELSTGRTSDAFRIPLSSPEMGESQFVFTESSVFVLDVGDDLDAPLDLSRYDLATGEREPLLRIPGTGSVHDGLDMIIRDLALDPAWVRELG